MYTLMPHMIQMDILLFIEMEGLAESCNATEANKLQQHMQSPIIKKIV